MGINIQFNMLNNLLFCLYKPFKSTKFIKKCIILVGERGQSRDDFKLKEGRGKLTKTIANYMV